MLDHNRQGFLEPELSHATANATIGVVGLSGGGSHIVQQLSHVGFNRFVTYDPKVMEAKHLHRLVCGTVEDVELRRSKTEIAQRTIRGIRPDASIESLACSWQENAEPLRRCDLIFGCVDTFRGRWELEILSRRYCIPYIDIGIDVTCTDGHPPRMAGQVILSAPGGACMWCLGFLTREILAREGSEYGDAGGRPQVVWLNGSLASMAVGIAVDYLTGKFGPNGPPIFSVLDGNRCSISQHPRLRFVDQRWCPHYDIEGNGDPRSSAL